MRSSWNMVSITGAANTRTNIGAEGAAVLIGGRTLQESMFSSVMTITQASWTCSRWQPNPNQIWPRSYPDPTSILPRYYPALTWILPRSYPDLTQMLPRSEPELNQILPISYLALTEILPRSFPDLTQTLPRSFPDPTLIFPRFYPARHHGRTIEQLLRPLLV